MTEVVAQVVSEGSDQHVRIPAEFRFATDEVYVSRNGNGTISISEKPLRRSMAEVLRELDEAGAADFVLERDTSPLVDRDLF